MMMVNKITSWGSHVCKTAPNERSFVSLGFGLSSFKLTIIIKKTHDLNFPKAFVPPTTVHHHHHHFFFFLPNITTIKT